MPYITVCLLAEHLKEPTKFNPDDVDAKIVDMVDLAKQIENQYNEWELTHEVVNVIPIAVGSSEPARNKDKLPVGVASYSVTRGVIMVGKELTMVGKES